MNVHYNREKEKTLSDTSSSMHLHEEQKILGTEELHTTSLKYFHLVRVAA